jgi:hypothetical protein
MWTRTPGQATWIAPRPSHHDSPALSIDSRSRWGIDAATTRPTEPRGTRRPRSCAARSESGPCPGCGRGRIVSGRSWRSMEMRRPAPSYRSTSRTEARARRTRSGMPVSSSTSTFTKQHPSRCGETRCALNDSRLGRLCLASQLSRLWRPRLTPWACGGLRVRWPGLWSDRAVGTTCESRDRTASRRLAKRVARR